MLSYTWFSWSIVMEAGSPRWPVLPAASWVDTVASARSIPALLIAARACLELQPSFPIHLMTAVALCPNSLGDLWDLRVRSLLPSLSSIEWGERWSSMGAPLKVMKDRRLLWASRYKSLARNSTPGVMWRLLIFLDFNTGFGNRRTPPAKIPYSSASSATAVVMSDIVSSQLHYRDQSVKSKNELPDLLKQGNQHNIYICFLQTRCHAA